MGEHFRQKRDDGASLVEFALLMPLLLMLLLGIVEFGWLFSQNLDVRHGAREGARLAAVNYPNGPSAAPPARTAGNTSALIAEICSRMDTASEAAVTVNSAGDIEDPIEVTVQAPGNTLTGFLNWAIPSDLTLSSTVETRVEQYPSWANGTQDCP